MITLTPEYEGYLGVLFWPNTPEFEGCAYTLFPSNQGVFCLNSVRFYWKVHTHEAGLVFEHTVTVPHVAT